MIHVFDQLGYWFLSAFAVFMRALPLKVALGFGALLGRIVFFVSNRRRVAYSDMKAAFEGEYHGRALWRRVMDHYENHGRMLVEVLRFPLLDKEFLEKNIEIEGLDRYQNLVKQNKGIVLLTAHFGNWELLQIVSGILGRPVHALAREQKFPKLDGFLNKLRESHGSVAIMRGMGIRAMLKSLKRGDLVGLLGDQDAGRDQGIIVPLFGRKTTIPLGAFQLAARTKTPILPCFIARGDDKKSHHICVGEPIECADESEEALEPFIRSYIDALENFVRKYPNQWLWETKRWKYTWTKRILILSDGKPGHYKQSEAVAARFKKITHQYGRPGMEYPTETIEVEYRSEWRRKLFAFFSLFFIPFCQGRLGILKFFLKTECFHAIEKASTDFVISAGSSLVPLNLVLARESRAKSVVLMKPAFPFNFYRYDLAFVPSHDRGILPKKEVFRTTLTPSNVELDSLETAHQKLAATLSNPEKVKLALFLGGATGNYNFSLNQIKKVFEAIKKTSSKVGDYLVTTSRRTGEDICNFIRDEIKMDPACQDAIIASEDSRPEVVNGMMSIAETLIVTEDSISMISEAAATGKQVIVLELNPESLSAKHQRFKAELAKRGIARVVRLDDLEKTLAELDTSMSENKFHAENEAMLSKLQAIL